MQKYGVFETINNLFSFIMTRLFYPKARLIRYPIYIRGRQSISIGKGLTLGYSCRFDLSNKKLKTLIIGEKCQLGDNVHIVGLEKVVIGNNVLMASNVFISDTEHGCYSGLDQTIPDIPPADRKLFSKPVYIGNNVWIGQNAVVLAGTEIGDGCIIGANSVIKGKFGKNEILVGAPVRVIKRFNNCSDKWEKI